MNNSELANTFCAIRNGDKNAFDELYQDLQTPIYTIIFRITWDKALSEDIMQNIFVKLFSSPPDSSVKNFRAYIFQMAHNQAINSMKEQSRHVSLDEICDTVHQPLDDYSLRMDVDYALKTLLAQECQVVILHVIGKLKFREISKIMDLPLGTVLWKYQKALSKLKKHISGDVV